MKSRVAVVTGGNRGLGWEIVRQLARQDILVILTARDAERGMMAAREFQREESLAVRFLPLDVTSPASIDALGAAVEREFGRCDVLVNNAGIFPDIMKDGKCDHDADDPAGVLGAPLENIRRAMETNVYGPVMLCQRLVPVMKKNNYGRIVNMSSGLGQLKDFQGDARYLAYRLSKTALNMVTRSFAAAVTDTNILVNSCCPGWCRTDMGGPYGVLPPDKGADTPVWLATLPDGGPTGKFFRERQEISW